MPVLPIVEVPDSRLRSPSAPVEGFDARLSALANDMFATMYAAPGIGLAAVQVGVPVRLVVMDLVDGPEDEDGQPTRRPLVFVNPEILALSEERQVTREGCLSIPGQYADVERPARVTARWQGLDGRVDEAELDGLAAVCLQHEIDHLNGVLFIDHLSRLKRDMLLKRLDKARAEERRREPARSMNSR